MSRIIAKNKKNIVQRAPFSQKKSKIVTGNTVLVSRKYNYKECALCQGLYMNLSDHVHRTHNISRDDPNYENYVKSPKVIPKVFTKLEGRKRVQLKDKELEDAKGLYGQVVEEQNDNLHLLKDARKNIEAVKEEMRKANSKEEYEEFKSKLSEKRDIYISLRYKDNRKYNAKTKAWHDCYKEHLVNKSCKNPKRIVSMALDVLLCYEKTQKLELTFVDLIKPKIIRQILRNFRNESKHSYASRIKYVAQFNKLVKFLMLDVDSPERREDSNMASRTFVFEEIKQVFQNEIDLLNKLKGKEMIFTKKRAKDKLLTESELEDLMKNNSTYLAKVNSDILEKKHIDYGIEEILKVRNSLIAAATLRIGRRSQEMTRMNLAEVAGAEESLVGEEKFFIINVADQKNSRTGKPAPIAYTEAEFSTLKAFIADMRPKLIESPFCDIVFSSSSKLTSHVDQDLTLSAAFKVMQKYKTAKGKKVSSRSIRGSKITISRQKNLPNSTLDHLANAMSHKRSTADGYYDFNSLEVSVRETQHSVT